MFGPFQSVYLTAKKYCDINQSFGNPFNPLNLLNHCSAMDNAAKMVNVEEMPNVIEAGEREKILLLKQHKMFCRCDENCRGNSDCRGSERCVRNG